MTNAYYSSDVLLRLVSTGPGREVYLGAYITLFGTPVNSTIYRTFFLPCDAFLQICL